MAILLMDGFDYYNSSGLLGAQGAGWDSGMNISSFPTGVYGSGQQANVFGALTKILGTNYSTLITSFHATQGTTGGLLCDFRDVNTVQVSVYVSASTGIMTVYRGTNSGTLLATSSGVTMKQTQPVWVSVKVVFNNGAGSVLIRVNGATVINITGQNTISTANAYANKISIGSENQNNNYLIDNVFVCDTTGSAPYNDILAERRIYTQMPTGAGTASQWTPTGAATFWQCTDEIPPNSDTDYGLDSTPTNRSDITHTALTGVTVVDAVKLNLCARKDDAGVRTISPTVRQSGVYYDQTALSLFSTYQIFPTYLLAQPAGGAWTLATYNAAEFGVLDVS